MKSLNEIMKMINLQEEVVSLVLEIDKNLELSKYMDEIKQLQNIDTAASAREILKEKLAPDEKNLKMLTIMLHALRYTKENYEKHNISTEIFIETAKAFTRFIKETHELSDSWIYNRDWWSYRQIAMSIFRIGELEYEMKDVDGKKYISLHIPSDAKMAPSLVIDSLKESLTFFKKYYPDYYGVKYFCKTWLLSSDLKNILPKESNLINFINLFVITKEVYNSKSFMTWIYKKAANNDVDDLPEATTLQRNLKKYLKDGNSVSEASGYIDFEKLGLSL